MNEYSGGCLCLEYRIIEIETVGSNPALPSNIMLAR